MFLFPRTAEAHVRYIADDATVENLSGSDFSYLLSALGDSKNLIIIATTLVFIILIVWLLPKVGFLKRKFSAVDHKAESYKNLVPWMARLSIGIALIGAGTSEYLINPVVQNTLYAQAQIILGFLIMSGFLTSFAVLATLYLFVVAFLQDWYLVGAFDVLGLLVLLLVYDARRPGIDDVAGIPDFHWKKMERSAERLFRFLVGGGLVFLAVYEKILNPHLSAFVVEATNLTSVINVSPSMWVLSSGLVEALLGVLIIIGYRVRLVSIVTFVVLALSFFYFKEDVTSHITLFGSMAILFVLAKRRY